MGIYELLSAKQDARKGTNSTCDFNGYLEDYADGIEEGNLKDVFAALLEVNNNLRIITNFRMGVSKDSISNSIIRYKDIFKLEDKALTVPYMIYGKQDDKEKALILVDSDYIFAKGLYYALTEPSSAFQEAKNDVVALEVFDKNQVVETYKAMFQKRAGQVQRDLDKKHYKDYDDSFAKALAIASEIKDSVYEKIAEAQDKDAYIKSCVSRWYLIKKFVYVQYMVDKELLASRHEGNVKAQRNKAKENADSIRFISVSEMWRGSQNKGENSAE